MFVYDGRYGPCVPFLRVARVCAANPGMALPPNPGVARSVRGGTHTRSRDEPRRRRPTLQWMATSPRVSVVEASSQVHAQCDPYRRTVALIKGPGAETFVVDTRASDGMPRKSCWELVFPLLSSTPEPVSPGEVLQLDVTVSLGAAVNDPVTYDLQARAKRDHQGVDGSTGSTSRRREPVA